MRGLPQGGRTHVPYKTQTDIPKEEHVTAQKQTDAGSSRSAIATAAQATRKPWKKKTPVEVVLDQINRVREDVAKREEELKVARRQLQKLEDARKLLEST